MGAVMQLLTWDKGASKGKYKCKNCLAYIKSQREASLADAAEEKAQEEAQAQEEPMDFDATCAQFIPWMAEQLMSVLNDAFEAGVRKGQGKGGKDGKDKAKGKGGSSASRSSPY
jgi:hypothetical protein